MANSMFCNRLPYFHSAPLLIGLILSMASANATLYRHIDADGNVTYSDRSYGTEQPIELEDNGSVTGIVAQPEPPPTQATQQQADYLTKLDAHLQRVNQALAKAEQQRGELEKERKKCLSARRVGIRDLSPCARLSGDEKSRCVSDAPITYNVSSPENCNLPVFKTLNTKVDELKKLRQQDLDNRQKLLTAFPELADEK